MAAEKGADVVPHVRPRQAELGHPWASHPKACICDLQDSQVLRTAISHCTTIVQLIGTTRTRFATGDTYQSSDIDTTALLLEAATGSEIDHFVLLSSVGAGQPVGQYLKAKATTERIVRQSGIDWTILRPSSFHGGGHVPPPPLYWMTSLLETIGANSAANRLRPIPLRSLAGTILHIAASRQAINQTLEASSLWRAVANAGFPSPVRGPFS